MAALGITVIEDQPALFAGFRASHRQPGRNPENGAPTFTRAFRRFVHGAVCAIAGVYASRWRVNTAANPTADLCGALHGTVCAIVGH